MKSSYPWTVFLTVVCFAGFHGQLSPQSCTSLPHNPNEIWVATGVLGKGGAQWEEVAFEASPGDRFGLSLRRTTGGLSQDHGLEAWAARFGVPFRRWKAGFCLFGGFELNDFNFVDRFDVDRGTANYLAREAGLSMHMSLVRWAGAEVLAWVAPAAAYLRFEAKGRTLVVGDGLWAEERHFGKKEWALSGQAGLTFRWRILGVSGGASRRPALSSGTLAFLRVGIAVLPNSS